MEEFESQRKEVAAIMRRLYEMRLTTTSGGNVSLRMDDKIFITPSQTDKGQITAKEVGILDIDGHNFMPHLKPSMESKMHLAIYQKRHDVKAIVHAHPVFATSFCISRKEIKTRLAGEAWAVIGKPIKAEYRLMGTTDLANVAAEASLKGNVILLENHGVLTVGSTLLQAFDRLEVTEAAAKMTFITGLLGDYRELDDDQVDAINRLFE
ncbi:MAG: class II aldolase/adducin family protein [Bacteroidales bacterium]|nr:class II aldolase/adducin family protein [Bacteroidales bacterium]MCF8403523.1 class II aldolase/adducin family protein [Bacteroidales bacterium]